MSKNHLNGKPSGIPDLNAAASIFSEFVTTIAWLRDKNQGCPWDLEQDHNSLRRYMVEEAYEAAEAMSSDDHKEICDELGDVLLQVILNAQIAKDEGHFTIVDVIDAINRKMLRRHPHVFAPNKDEITSDEVRTNWEKIKASEKSVLPANKENSGVFSGAAKKHPSTIQALHIGKTAAKINFDWDTPNQVFDQLKSEVSELEYEVRQDPSDLAKITQEIGDVYFSLAQLCRHLKLDPETVAMDGNRKFLNRFTSLETIAGREGKDVKNISRGELEQFWLKAKAAEKKLK
jgi:tetrapyrrole methylase family protein/MazG family protein